jgi:hypothetical protein
MAGGLVKASGAAEGSIVSKAQIAQVEEVPAGHFEGRIN